MALSIKTKYITIATTVLLLSLLVCGGIVYVSTHKTNNSKMWMLLLAAIVFLGMLVFQYFLFRRYATERVYGDIESTL